MDTRRKQVVGYVRVSTDMQVREGHSIEAQQDDIMRYCLYKNYEFVRHYTDEGESGKSTQRKYLQLMLAELQPGTVIVTKSLSRLSRSLKDILQLMEDIKNKRASIVILDLDIDSSTPAGDLMFNVMGAIAQFERKNTALKVSNTLDHMSREGKLITKPRFGYRVVKNGKVSELVEDPDEQLIIDKVRNYIREDSKITISSIARKLNDDNVVIRKAKCVYPHFVKKVIADNNLR